MLKELYKNLIEKSKEKEERQQKFFNNKNILNNFSGEIFSLNYEHKKYITKYFNYLIQKVMYLQYTNQDNLQVFFTLTLPSGYHPFKNKLKNINPNFEFERNIKGMKQSINKGSSELYNLFRSFYLSLKNDRDTKKYFKKLDYFNVMEFHKSYIPHSHFLIYFPLIKGDKNLTKKIIMKKWENFIKRKNLNEKTNIMKFLKGEKGGSLYVSKYIQKTLKNLLEEDKKDNLHFFMGWKSLLNRIFYSSRVGISRKVYEKLFYNMDIDFKNELIRKSKEKGTCLMYELEQITTIKKVYNNKNKLTQKIKKSNDKNNMYYVSEVIEVEENFSIDKMKVEIKDILDLFNYSIYNKNIQKELLKTQELKLKIYKKDRIKQQENKKRLLENLEHKMELNNNYYDKEKNNIFLYHRFMDFLNEELKKFKDRLEQEHKELENHFNNNDYIIYTWGSDTIKEIINKKIIELEKMIEQYKTKIQIKKILIMKQFQKKEYRTKYIKVYFKNLKGKYKKLYNSLEFDLVEFH